MDAAASHDAALQDQSNLNNLIEHQNTVTLERDAIIPLANAAEIANNAAVASSSQFNAQI